MTPRGCIPIVRCVLLVIALAMASVPLAAGIGQDAAAQQPAAAPLTGGPTVSVDANNEDLVAVVNRLAADAKATVVFSSPIRKTVTITLRNTPFEQALALIGRVGGLRTQKIDSGYVISETQRVIYRVQHIRADRLLDTLKAAFDPEHLKVIMGPDEYYAPKLPPKASATPESSSSYGGGGNPPPPTPPPPPGAIRQIILMGDGDVVARAVALCRETDVPRKQVRFSVKFTHFDFNWLRQFGVEWSWSRVNVGEQAHTGLASPPDRVGALSIGTLTRNPVFIEAALKAAEGSNAAALKSIPSITVLDGEMGSFLVGEKHLYPKLTGYTQAQTPTYDKEEVSVGITLNLSVKVSDSDDMVLTLYPQVSGIIGYLEAGGTLYPQISTLEQQTSVHVRDGETIVIGGLLSEKTVDEKKGIPGLMRMPVLGKLFTFENKQIQKQDLVVLITAEIVREGVR